MRAMLDAINRQRFVVRGVIVPKNASAIEIAVRFIHAGVENCDGGIRVAVEAKNISRKARCPNGSHTT